MAIRYKVVKHKQLKNTKSEYHIAPYSPSNMDSEMVAKNICDFTSFSHGDYDGMIRAIQTQLILAFKSGRPVVINRIGKFSLKIGSRKIVNPDRSSNISLYVKGIHFEPNRDLMIELIDVDFKQIKDSKPEDSFILSKRLDNIVALVDEWERISPWDAATVNKCTLRTAYRDIAKLVEMKLIKKDVRGVFVKVGASECKLTKIRRGVY